MSIKLQAVKHFYISFPEYKGKDIYFAGWCTKKIDKYRNYLIRVKIDNHYEFFDLHWFKDLFIRD